MQNVGRTSPSAAARRNVGRTSLSAANMQNVGRTSPSAANMQAIINAMLERLKAVLENQCLLDPFKPTLVGVSGGPDSLCLLDVLSRLGYCLVAAHLNHGLRPEAEAEAQLVERLARELGAGFVREDADVRLAARQGHLSIEEAARNLRYRFLFRQAQLHNAQAVVVGHTADDQVETLLMHLLRGAGIAGLKGMLYRWTPNPWSAEIPLARPLLGVWRSEILSYLAERGYQPAYDASNLDLTYFRNRLRHELIPHLQGYSRNVKAKLWRTAELLREDYLLLQQVVDEAWEACFLGEDPARLRFSLAQWQKQPVAVQRYLVRRVFERLNPGGRDVPFRTVERALAFVAQPTRSRRMALSQGVQVFLEAGELCFARAEVAITAADAPQIAAEMLFDPDQDAPLALGGGWRLFARREQLTPDLLQTLRRNADPFQAWFDGEWVQPPLVVRPRRPGDRFKPLGMDGHSLKLADFMVNVKMPSRWRRGWPLICAGGATGEEKEILWVPGYRQSHICRVTQSTRQVFCLQLRRG